MIKHFVLIKYQPATPDAHVDEFCRRMLELRSRIAGILALEIGRDILHDERSWDLILVMEFASIADLRLYQQHPAHRAVMDFNGPYVANVAAVDYETTD